MANRRITDLPAISSASINDDDLLMVVDVAEVDPGLKNKKLNFSDTKQYFNSYYLQLTGGTIAGSLVVSNNLTVSGSFSPVNITVTGSGVFNDIVVTGSGRFTNYLSGNTITGGSIQGLNINATTGNVTTLIAGTATVGTGTFTRISGITITGTSGLFTTGNFLQISGTTGLFSSLSGTNVTGVNIVGTTQISGAIVTGNTGRFSDVTGVSGVFTTRLSGATITGDTILFTTATGATGTFTRVSGTTVTGATGLFAQLTGVSGAFIQLSGTTVTGATGLFTNLTGSLGTFTNQISGAIVTGITGQFTNLQGVSGVFTGQVSGSTITGDAILVSTLTGASGTFTRVSGTTVTGITGLFQTVTALTGTFINTISIPSIATTGNITAGGNLFISGNGTFSSGIVVSGQISGNSITGITGTFGDLTSNNLYGLTSVSGNLVTGVTGAFTQVTATTGTFTTRLSGNTITGNSISGTSGVFVSGIFTNVSGTVVTGNTGRFSEITGVSGTFTSNISGQTVTGVTGSFTYLNGVSGVFTDNLSGSVITGDTGRFTTVSGISGVFTGTLSGATVTGGSANFTSITGINATITNTLSGATVTGSNASFTRITGVSGVFTTQLSGQNVVGENATFNYITGTTRVEGGTISGATVTGNVGLFTNLTGVSGVFTSRVSGAYITGVTIEAVTVTAITGNFTTANFTQTTTGNILASGFISGVSGLFTASNVSGIGSGIFGGGVFTTGTVSGTFITGQSGQFQTVSGTTVTGATGLFASVTGVSGVFTSQLSGAVITGDTGNFNTLNVETAIISTGIVKQNITVTGNIQTSGTLSVGQTATIASGLTVSGGTISGVTFTGASGQFTALTGNTAGFTTVTGTTVTGTTANFVTGTFTTIVSGATITGNTGSFTTITGATGVFTSFSGTTVNVATGVFASGTAASPSITFSGDLNTGIYSPGADQVAISTGGSGRLFVDASGRVGLGVASSSADFLVGQGTSAELRIGSNGTFYGSVHHDFNTAVVTIGQYGAFGAAGMRFLTQGTERLRITSAGLVGIGTASPAYTLDVVGSTTAARIGKLNILDDSPFVTGANLVASSSFAIGTQTASPTVFFTNNSERLRIDSSGRVGVGTSSPSSLMHLQTTSTNVVLQMLENNGSTVYGASIDAFNSSGGNIRLRLHDSGGTYQERLRITSTGNVGIGTSSPSTLLDLSSSTNTYQTIQSTNANNNALTYYKNSAAVSSGFYVGFNADEEAMLWQSENNAIRIGTNNAERIRIDSSGRVGIGTTSPGTRLEVSGADGEFIRINTTTSAGGYMAFRTNTVNMGFIGAGDQLGGGTATDLNVRSQNSLTFCTNGGNERARIDSSGRLLVGTSTSLGTTAFDPYSIQLAGTNDPTSSAGFFRFQANTGASILSFTKSRGASVGTNTIVADGDNVGILNFRGADGTGYIPAAQIACQIDGTPGTNDMPGRLVFSTTADGASSPTERLRIANNGAWGLAGANYGTSGQVLTSNGSGSAPTWQSAGGSSISVADTSAAVLDSGTDGRFVVTCDGNERMRVTTGGQLRLATAGITFNGDTATANELDDYEEGVWNVTLNGSISATAATAKGFYVKIGSLVYINYVLEVASQAGSSAMQFQSLPFTSASSTANNNKATTLFVSSESVPNGTRGLAGYITPGTTTVNLYKVNDNAVFSNLTVADMVIGDKIYLSGWYSV